MHGERTGQCSGPKKLQVEHLLADPGIMMTNPHQRAYLRERPLTTVCFHVLPFLPIARGLEKGSTAPTQFPSAGMDKGRGFPEKNTKCFKKSTMLLRRVKIELPFIS